MSKYHNKKIILDSLKFDSLRECNRYCELKLLERSGTIKDLKMQVPFVLVEKSEHGNKLVYIADFVYQDQDGELDDNDEVILKPSVSLPVAQLAVATALQAHISEVNAAWDVSKLQQIPIFGDEIFGV